MKTEINKKIKIVVPNKGRLYDPALNLLRNVGLDFDIDERKMSSQVTNFDIEILYASASNIPEYVEGGIVDLGITGLDLVRERAANVKVMSPLHFGRTKLVIAVPDGSKIHTVKDLNGKKIGTTFVHLTKSWLTKNKVKAEVVEVDGAVEVTPRLGLVDAICDLSSSGSSLRVNKLRAIETILESEAVLIGNLGLLKKHYNDIETLLLRIESVLTANARKYIMMNAPEKILPKIKNIAPGLSSPTIMKLSKEGMIAVHSVIDAKDAWRIVEELKKIGASGILVMPIEKMIF